MNSLFLTNVIPEVQRDEASFDSFPQEENLAKGDRSNDVQFQRDSTSKDSQWNNIKVFRVKKQNHPRSRTQDNFYPREASQADSRTARGRIDSDDEFNREIDSYEVEWNQITLRDAMRQKLLQLSNRSIEEESQRLALLKPTQGRKATKENNLGIAQRVEQKTKRNNSRELMKKLFRKVLKDARDSNTQPFATYEKEIQKASRLEAHYTHLTKKPAVPDNYKLRTTSNFTNQHDDSLNVTNASKLHTKRSNMIRNSKLPSIHFPLKCETSGFSVELVHDIKRAFFAEPPAQDRMYLSRLNRIAKQVSKTYKTGGKL